MNNATKKHTLIEQTAKELGENPEVVAALVNSYFGSIQDIMSSAEELSIDLPDLGRFVVINKYLKTKMLKTEKTIQSKDPSKSMRSFSIVKNLTEDLEKYNALMLKMDALYDKKRTKRAERTEYEELNKDLEE